MVFPADFLTRPLDQTAPEAAAFQTGIQGNILKGHGRDHVALMFIAFNDRAAAARAWVAGPMRARISSAASQAADTAQWRQARDKGGPFLSLLLSYSGHVRLGVPDDATPKDAYFRTGMKSTPLGVNSKINDPPVARWDPDYRRRVDALIVIGDEDVDRLQGLVSAIQQELQPLAERVFVERGDKLRFDFPGRPRVEIEHFGHQDGISQPQMIKQEADAEIAARGGANWNPEAPLAHAFSEEGAGSGNFGSYLVFRKLEQNVKSFHAARDAMALELGIDADLASALAVGRHRDGRPLIPTTVTSPGADPNDFNFKSDTAAGLCPFQAHIRKTNPRGDLAAFLGATDEIERRSRISRRGITYGPRPDLEPGATATAPEAGIGLLFMCYQANIGQFAIQQDGSDSNDFVQTSVGVDAVIGNNAAPVAQRWPLDGQPTSKLFTMANFVSFKGGEYFYAPSIAFLEGLAPRAA